MIVEQHFIFFINMSLVSQGCEHSGALGIHSELNDRAFIDHNVRSQNIWVAHKHGEVLETQTGSPDRVVLAFIVLLFHCLKDGLAEVEIVSFSLTSTVKDSIQVVQLFQGLVKITMVKQGNSSGT